MLELLWLLLTAVLAWARPRRGLVCGLATSCTAPIQLHRDPTLGAPVQAASSWPPSGYDVAEQQRVTM
jgi:hypothetical protein